MLTALEMHWPEYLMEAALLGLFMVSACIFGALLEHPGSTIRRRLPSPQARRLWMGIAMGATAVLLIYSPWGQQSGAHMNPATTLTFLLRGIVTPWDAAFYITAQFIGGVLGVLASALILRGALRHDSVAYVVTLPGRGGIAVAFGAELAISFGMMMAVLVAGNHERFAPYTGFFAGALLLLYIAFEAPYSGMSLNPARTMASAVFARKWNGLWVYFIAPVLGMFMASSLYSVLPGRPPVYCAKLDHCNDRPCIFHCRFGEMNRSQSPSAYHSANTR